MACKRSPKNECKVSENQLEGCENLTSVESTILEKKILNSANVIFASASLGSRRLDCGDGAKNKQWEGERLGGGGIARPGRIFPDPGFDQNTVQHSENVDGKRDLTASEEAGSDAGLGKKTMLGISLTEVRDAGFSWKSSRNARLGSPPPPFSDLSVEG